VEVFGASGIEHWPLLRLHLCLLLRLHLHLLLRLLLRLNPSPATPVAAPTKPCAPRRGLLLLLFRLPGCRAGCSACCSAGCPFHLARLHAVVSSHLEDYPDSRRTKRIERTAKALPNTRSNTHYLSSKHTAVKTEMACAIHCTSGRRGLLNSPVGACPLSW
jgi:hypothetical protein